jgi:hypothetical protein
LANTGGGPLIAGGRGLSTPGYDEEAKPAAKPLPEAPTEQPAAAAPAPLRDLNEDYRKAKEAKVTTDKLAQSKDDLAQLEAEKQGQPSGKLQAMKKEQRREGPTTAMKTENLPLNGRQMAPMTVIDGAARSDSARRFGGRTFQRKEGVWYDSNYHGQATINVSRGTDSYKKLDSGLRSIADSMSGTVVVVWKSKAYRIQ